MPAIETAPDTSERLDAFSADEVDQFHRDGYVIVRGLASDALCERMLAVTQRDLLAAAPPVEYEADLQYPGAPAARDVPGGSTIRRLKQAHCRDFAFTEWVSHPPLTAQLRQLLGEDVVMPLAHHNCIMTKQPWFSSGTGWHQDIRYWSFRRPDLVSVWLALGSENRQNGCLRLIPGSHRLDLQRSRLDDSLFFCEHLAENRDSIARSVDAPLERGDVLFFHCRTLHAADRNQTAEPKFSVVFTFRSGDNPPRPGSRSASLPELILPHDAEVADPAK